MKETSKINLSIIMPAYNEEKRIGNTLEKYGLFYTKLKKEKYISDFEILIILNNCKDKTLDIVIEKQKKYSEIRFLNFEKGGKGFAITQGFKDSLTRENNLIGFVDSDLATSPEEFYKLIKDINNYDGVIASRALKDSKANFTFKRKLTHRGFNFVVRSLLFLNYRDTQCGAKIFKRKVIEQVIDKIGETKWAYDIDLLYKIKKSKFKIKEIPTIWEDKEGSKMKSVLKVSIQMFLGVIRLRIIHSPFKRFIKLYGKLPRGLQIHNY